MDAHVRWMINRDLDEVAQIEVESFQYPWSRDDIVRHLRQRNAIGLVAEHDSQVVGFVIYELHSRKLVLVNLAVSWLFRRRGVGTAMINKLAGKLSPARRSRIEVMVRECNLDAQLFLQATGFRATRVIKEPYEETDEDGYLMVYRVPVLEGVA